MPLGGAIRNWTNNPREYLRIVEADPTRVYQLHDLIKEHIDDADTRTNHTQQLGQWDAERRRVGADPRDPRAVELQLREAHTAALAEQKRACDGRPPIDEVVANMRRLVDEAAARWGNDRHYSMLIDFGGGMELRTDGSIQERRPQMHSLQRVSLDSLIGLAPELVKARLEEILRSQPYEAGAPLADRPRLIAEADVRIREIEDQHETLVNACGQLDPPITLRHLTPVQERRDRESLEARREADRSEEERRRAAELDARIVAKAQEPRGGRSAYIESRGEIHL